MTNAEARSPSSAMIFAAAPTTQVNEDGNQQDEQIHSLKGHVSVNHPGIRERGDRQENKADQGNQQPVIGALQVSGGEEHDGENNSRERENDDQ